MSIAVKNTTKLAIEEEVTEGTYVTPAGASSFIQTLESGLEIKPSKELLERSVFAGTIGKVTPRTGTKSVSGSVPTEMRAYSTEGSAPEFNSLLKSAFGSRRQNTTNVTTKASGNTATVLQIEDADISKFNIGDIIMVKQSGAYHVSPITAKSTGTGTATITMLVAHPSGDCTDSVVISKFSTYYCAESGHPTLSISKYIDDAVLETAYGCRVNKFSIENFATGKIPTLNFGFDGLNFSRSLTAPSYTPSYDTALPPIMLDGRVYQDGSAIVINDLSVSLENTVGFATSIAASNGKTASRVTGRKITGSFNPYQQTDSIANYTKFLNNTEFSLFAYGKVDTSTSGEFGNVVAVYMPKCLITELAEGDADGLVQESISFQASRGTAGTTNEIYFCFI
jgi:hypothetical protein